MVARWYQSTWVSSVDCHISINFSLSSWTCLLLFGFVFCTFDAFSGLFSVNSSFILPYCHVPWSTSPNSFIGYTLHAPDLQCQHDVKCNFHMLRVNCMSQIYSIESPIDTTSTRIVWGSHGTTIKWSLLSHSANHWVVDVVIVASFV